jgi:hypothetical protein
VVIALLLLSFIPLSTPTSAVPEARLFSVEVSIAPGPSIIDVSPGQDGTYSFNGNCSVDTLTGFIGSVTVELNASINAESWSASITPEQLSFSGTGSETFTVTVMAPEATAVIARTVTVRADASSPIESDTSEVRATIRVGQYFRMAIESLEGFRSEAEPGGSIFGSFFINNTGNGADTIRLEIVDRRDILSDYDMAQTVEVPAGQALEVDFSFFIKDDYDIPSEGSTESIVIRATSVGAEEDGATYVVRADYALHFKSFQTRLVESWPTIAGAVGALVVVGIVAWFVMKKVRGRSEVEDKELLKKLGKTEIDDEEEEEGEEEEEF